MTPKHRPLLLKLSAALLLILIAAAPALAAAAAADDGPLGRAQLRERLLPVYQNLLTDPTFLALRDGLAGNLENRQVVDRYLAYLPMSPKEMLELEMFTRRFEIPIPRFLEQWHRRWIVLHPAAARDLYGAAAVARARSLPPGEEPGAPALAPRAGIVGPNHNLAYNFPIPPDDYQGEVQVVVNPNNPNQIVAASNTWDNIPGTCNSDTQAIFYSSDGGATWGYTCSPDKSGYPALAAGCAGGIVFGSDPALAWNDANEVFINQMLICYTGTYHYSMVVARSTDGGATWAGQGVVKNSWGNTNLEDKNFYAIDNHAGSPFHGRHYTCWDRNNNEKSAYSTNNGVTWTEVDLPTTPSSGSGGAYDLACELEVQSDGTVHVVYDTLRCLSTCNNEQMFSSHSTDGGLTWSAPVLVADFNLVGFSGANCPGAQDGRCIGPFGAVGVDNSGGPCDGYLYATYGDWTSGGVNTTDVFVRRSTDGGATWGPAVQVNDDGPGGNIQFHPFLQVDSSNGTPVVAWHDARNYPGNHMIDFFTARSLDCGLTFEPNVQASQPSNEFNNNTISWTNFNSGDNSGVNPNQGGEYMGLDVHDGKAYLAWCDTRHYFPMFPSEPQKENIGFAVVTFDKCQDGRTEGQWNLPVGGLAGGAKGTLYDAASAALYTIRATLVETSPGKGTLSGSLYDLAGTPVYNTIGDWKITVLPGTGTFEAKIAPLVGGASVGIITGRFRDNPLGTTPGKFVGTWEICP
jgi:hypothetical protein